jgi:hypothetical protein
MGTQEHRGSKGYSNSAKLQFLEETQLEQISSLAELSGKLEALGSQVETITDSLKYHREDLEKCLKMMANSGEGKLGYGTFQKAIVGAILVQALFHGVASQDVFRTIFQSIFSPGTGGH